MATDPIQKQVRATIYDSLRKELSKPTKKNGSETYIETFVRNMLNTAKKDPTSEAARLVSKVIFTEDIFDKLDSEAERLILRDKEFAKFRIYKTLYDKQREVAYDTAVERKCIVCSRRAGKTELAARLLVLYCIEPNTPVLYIHNKMANALSQCWPIVIQTAKDIELQMTKVDKQNARIEFINGSVIQMFANHDKSSAQFLRGGRYKLIIIEEAQSHRNMNELVDDVVTPMLLDFPQSCLILQGTPPRIPNTYFERAYKTGKYKNYHWTAKDNPFIKNYDEFLQNVCESKQIDMNNSLIQREYLGNFVYDTEAMVFKDNKQYTDQPTYPITDIVIGSDFGFADYNSIIGVAIDKYKQKGYVFFEWKQNKIGTTEIIEATKSAYDLGLDILRKSGIPPEGHIKIFGDTSDGTLLYEMRKRHGLPTFNAYKINRLEAIAKLSERCRLGDFLIPENGILADEFLHIMYVRDEEDRITAEIDDEIFHPEAAMSLLYASRYIEELFLQDKSEEEDLNTYSVIERTKNAHDDIPDILLVNDKTDINNKSKRYANVFY